MKLTSSIREHYTTNNGIDWRPKKPFESRAELKKFLGPRFWLKNYYLCRYCSKYHIATHKNRPKKGKRK